MASDLKLKKYISYTGLLVCKTGMRIGGTESAMGIGSAENPVIKDARGMPYIPGSSLKGKLRSLLEYKYKRVGENGSPCGCGNDLNICPVCTIFGPHRNIQHNLGPTRIIVRDAFLSEKSKKEWGESGASGKEFTETKTETAIDRRTGMAMRGSLRTQERVNAGTEFELHINLRVFDGDDESKLRGYVEESLKMLGSDYIGGSGTRGYGWVEMKDLKVADS